MVGSDNFANMLNQNSYNHEELLQALSLSSKSEKKEDAFVMSDTLSAPAALKEVVRRFQQTALPGQLTSTGLKNLTYFCNDLKNNPVTNERQRKIVNLFTEGVRNPHFMQAMKAIDAQQVSRLRVLLDKETRVTDEEKHELLELIPNQLQHLPRSERGLYLSLVTHDFFAFLDKELKGGNEKGAQAALHALCKEAYKAGKLHTLLDKALPLSKEVKAQVQFALVDAMNASQKKGLFSKLVGKHDTLQIPYERSAALTPKNRETIDALVVDCASLALGVFFNKEYAKEGIMVCLKGAKGDVVTIEVPNNRPIHTAKIQKAIDERQAILDRFKEAKWITPSILKEHFNKPTQDSNSPKMLYWIQGTKALEAALVNEQKREFQRELDWMNKRLDQAKSQMRSGDVDRVVTDASLGKVRSLLQKASTLNQLHELHDAMQDLRNQISVESPWQLQERYNESGKSDAGIEMRLEQAKRENDYEKVTPLLVQIKRALDSFK